MYIYISENSNIPIYEQIVRQIKDAIINMDIKADEPLPSIRSLAKDLQISVITTKRAYEDLEDEGLVYSVQGKGFFVRSRNIEILRERRIQVIEQELQVLIDEGKKAGLSMEDLCAMVQVLWESKTV